MNKSQQMRWSRTGADLLLQVRCSDQGSATSLIRSPAQTRNWQRRHDPPSFWTLPRNAAWSRAGNIAAAVLSGLIAWLFSTRAVFLQVPVLAALAAIVAMTIPYSKVDLRRARGPQPDDKEQRGPTGPLVLLRNRRLLVFAACSFLYELADAPLLTLVGQKLGTDQTGTGMIFKVREG